MGFSGLGPGNRGGELGGSWGFFRVPLQDAFRVLGVGGTFFARLFLGGTATKDLCDVKV